MSDDLNKAERDWANRSLFRPRRRRRGRWLWLMLLLAIVVVIQFREELFTTL